MTKTEQVGRYQVALNRVYRWVKVVFWVLAIANCYALAYGWKPVEGGEEVGWLGPAPKDARIALEKKAEAYVDSVDGQSASESP